MQCFAEGRGLTWAQQRYRGGEQVLRSVGVARPVAGRRGEAECALSALPRGFRRGGRGLTWAAMLSCCLPCAGKKAPEPCVYTYKGVPT